MASGAVNRALPLFESADFTFNEVPELIEALIHTTEPGVNIAPEIVDARIPNRIPSRIVKQTNAAGPQVEIAEFVTTIVQDKTVE